MRYIKKHMRSSCFRDAHIKTHKVDLSSLQTENIEENPNQVSQKNFPLGINLIMKISISSHK